MQAAAKSFDARELRQVLGSFVTGVTVITTVDGQGRPHGLTANSFSSVSLDPPLVLWSQSKTAPSHQVFSSVDRFAVNILADDQVAVSNLFARGGADKFAGVPLQMGMGGVPLVQGCAAYLECRKVHSYPGGDHVVFVGEVERIERHPVAPLVFGGGRYLVAQPHDGGALLDGKGPNVAQLQAIRMATRAMADLSDALDLAIGLGIWGNHGPTVIRWEESSEPIGKNLRTGLVLPVLGSATGLAFAAWLPPEMTTPFIDSELAATGLLGPDQELPGRLAQIRAEGVARIVATDRFADMYGGSINAVSVPVFGTDGAMVLALTAIGAGYKLGCHRDGALLERLRACAAALSRRLANQAPSTPGSPI
jgi:flavin reductase (DIM6/NTAB) family NADH-FMN oxidoreductase RutF/DNA-binding IclR family transcriptional regulator